MSEMPSTLPEPDGPSKSGRILAWPADLVAGARLRGAAETAGMELRLVRSADELERAARTESPRLIVVDLEARGDPAAAIARLKAEPGTARIPLVAFAPHVKEEAIAAARAAGAERVLARGAFFRDLPRLLAGE